LAAEKDTKTPILALKKNTRRCVLTPLSAGLAQMDSAARSGYGVLRTTYCGCCVLRASSELEVPAAAGYARGLFKKVYVHIV
jgi:hypothetical protein